MEIYDILSVIFSCIFVVIFVAIVLVIFYKYLKHDREIKKLEKEFYILSIMKLRNDNFKESDSCVRENEKEF